MTNTSPTNAYRGAGRPEANYIVERLVDRLRPLGSRPLKFAAGTSSEDDQMPYRTPTGSMFDSGDFPG